MREIKFRGYSKSNNEMFDNELLENAADGLYNIAKSKLLEMGYFAQAEDLERGVYLPTKDKDLVFMQYTGLKDKNGKEIYEGDILSYKHITYTDCSKTKIEEIEDESFIEIITYAPMASIVKPHSKNVKCFGYDSINKECLILDLTSDEVEVIGNKFENPELLG